MYAYYGKSGNYPNVLSVLLYPSNVSCHSNPSSVSCHWILHRISISVVCRSILRELGIPDSGNVVTSGYLQK